VLLHHFGPMRFNINMDVLHLPHVVLSMDTADLWMNGIMDISEIVMG